MSLSVFVQACRVRRFGQDFVFVTGSRSAPAGCEFVEIHGEHDAERFLRDLCREHDNLRALEELANQSLLGRSTLDAIAIGYGITRDDLTMFNFGTTDQKEIDERLTAWITRVDLLRRGIPACGERARHRRPRRILQIRLRGRWLCALPSATVCLASRRSTRVIPAVRRDVGSRRDSKTGRVELCSDDEPGVIYVPKPLRLQGLRLDMLHIVRVARAKEPKIFPMSV